MSDQTYTHVPAGTVSRRVDIRVCADDGPRAINLLALNLMLPEAKFSYDSHPPASGPEHEISIYDDKVTERWVRKLLEGAGIFVLAIRTVPPSSIAAVDVRPPSPAAVDLEPAGE